MMTSLSKPKENASTGSDEKKAREELLEEVRDLRGKYAASTQYIRQKVNQLLTVMGTAPLRPDELNDVTLIELDPIGIVSDSFAQVLLHLKETNEALRIAHDEITGIFNAAGMGILVVDRDMRILAYNKKAEEQFPSVPGITEKPFCYQLICRQDHPGTCCPALTALETGMSCQINQVIGERHYTAVATPIKDKDDAISRIVLVYMDMTERILTQEKLTTSEERYRDLFENSSDLIQIIGADGAIKFVNRAWLKTLGYLEQDLPDMSIFDIIHPDCKKCGPEFKSVVCGLRGGRVETSFITKDKREIIVEGDVTAVTEHGQFTGTRGIFRDITERKRAEALIDAERERLAVTLRSIGDGVITTDIHGNVVLINQVAVQLTGWEQAAAGGKPLTDVFSLVDKVTEERRYCPIDSVLRTGKVCELEGNAVLVSRDGARRLITDSVAPIRGKDNAIMGAVLVFRDITERKKLEDQLRQAQKMESIGTLAGGIAHDFNNILSAIIGYGHIALMKMPKDDPIRMNIEHILESADRAAALTQSLLAFSRKQISERKPVDLNTIIKKVEKFLVRVIGEDVAVHLTLAAGKLTILADAGQLEQVFMNFATNARDAMPHGGSFLIETSCVKLDKGFVSAHGYGKPGTYVLTSMTDTGMGMNEETRKKIFEPFFTTKEVGKGTGLGLAMVYGIVDQNEGYINVYSEPGKGTTFRIYFPLIDTAAGEGQKAIEAPYPKGGTETILLAEDDVNLRKLSVIVLEQIGYTVITASDGQEAVAKFMENKDGIQLLLFDLMMPRKNGKEAYEEIRRVRPTVPVLFVSGYSSDMIREKALVEEGVYLINKPMSPQNLLNKIREVLDQVN